MASKDKKPSKPSRNRTGYVRTLSDLNRPTADSDSDSDEPREYYTGGEKSGMLVQDPSKDDPVQAIFDKAKMSSTGGPAPEPSSSRTFSGTHRLLLGESAQPAPQQPENVVHNINFWANGFTVGEGPLRRVDDPENASFLESIKNSKCPQELEPADKTTSVYVSLTRRNESYPEPEKRHVPFQGVGRTLAGTSASVPSSSAPVSSHNSFPVANVVVDETMPQTSIQLRLADGSRLIGKFNHHHTISDLRSFIDGSRPEAPRNYLLQITGFPPVILSDPGQTIEQAGLTNSVVIQKY